MWSAGCNELVSSRLHCDSHYTTFCKSYTLYKKEQKKIEVYLNNPALIDKLNPKDLIRVAGVSLEVFHMRREHSMKGFKEESHDGGHKKDNRENIIIIPSRVIKIKYTV